MGICQLCGFEGYCGAYSWNDYCEDCWGNFNRAIPRYTRVSPRCTRCKGNIENKDDGQLCNLCVKEYENMDVKVILK